MTAEESAPESNARQMDKDKSDQMVLNSLASISRQLADLKAGSQARPGVQVDPTDNLTYESERTRATIETLGLQVEGAQFGQVRSMRKVQSLRAHAEGVISEDVDNEDMLTERLGLWASLLNRFDKKVAERNKQQHPISSQIVRIVTIVCLVAFAGLVVVEVTRPAVFVPASQAFNSFASNPYKASWLLGLAVAVGVPVTLFVRRWRRSPGR